MPVQNLIYVWAKRPHKIGALMSMDRKIEKRRWPAKKIITLAGGLSLLLSILYLIVMMDHRPTLRVSARGITISTVLRGEFRDFIPVSGTVIPVRTHYLDATEGGRVDSLYCDAGSFVKKGDRILKLANANLLMDIMYREAELVQQQNNLRNTRLAMEQNRLATRGLLLDLGYQLKKQRRNYENRVQLSERNLISAQELEEAKDSYEYLSKKLDLTLQTHTQDSLYRETQMAQLEQSLRLMELNLKMIRQNYDNLVVRAPVAGQLTSLNAEVGASKSRGERLGQIDVVDRFSVRADVDEYYVTRVSEGQTAAFTYQDQSFLLVVDKVYPEVRNGRFQVDLVFSETQPVGIRRGQTIHLRLELGGATDAVLLPRGGFYQDTGGQWVFLVNSAGKTAARQAIRLGLKNPDYFEVLSGLEPGDQVITSSYRMFGDAERLVLR